MEIDNKFKSKANKAKKNGVLFAYCPRHLAIDRREELWIFPLNILFSKFRVESDGTHTMGSAIYDPDLSSLKTDEKESVMLYRNQYGGDGCVIITFDRVELTYRGDKYVNGELVGSAVGKIKDGLDGWDEGWKLFFFHLTMLGLTNREQCKFEKVDSDMS
jgi:hypothetical protein